MPHRPAIASMSLGRAEKHNLPEKLNHATEAGFEGIELFFEDLTFVAQKFVDDACMSIADSRMAAARYIRTLCDERSLTILSLQPFMNYEGLLNRREHAERIEEMQLWFRLAQILGTDIIAIPSSFLSLEEMSSDIDLVIADLRELADLGLRESPVIRFAYESLAWGTHNSTWQQSWSMVQDVDRPNFGMCLDTFNIAAKVYADPASLDGKCPDADMEIQRSITEMCTLVDPAKVFFVQLVDAERLEAPLVPGHEFYVEEQRSRMSWSRNCRLFYGEQNRGGYLPIKKIANAILNGTGFEGWWSMELFHRDLYEDDSGIPEQMAKRGMASWKALRRDLHMQEAKDQNNVGEAAEDGAVENTRKQRNILKLVENQPKETDDHSWHSCYNLDSPRFRQPRVTLLT